jgi:hypothetical protein
MVKAERCLKLAFCDDGAVDTAFSGHLAPQRR